MSATEPDFLVNAYNEPVLIKVNGRACFHNAAPIDAFLKRMIDEGRRNFVFDFQNCTGMDSTFLGLLAGTGLRLMRGNPRGTVVLCRLGPRNLELVRNLGLHRIVTVDSGDLDMNLGGRTPEETLSAPKRSENEQARMVLKAHESLVEIDQANRSKFQDVIAFLKNQVDNT